MWKIIPGYSKYEVSGAGGIRSVKSGRLLRLYTNKKGYLYFCPITNLGKRTTLMVHRAVALAFITNSHCLETVNHKDMVKSNNDITNLEWMSNADNLRHAFKNGAFRQRSLTGSKHRKAIIQFSLSGELIKTWSSLCEIEKTLGYYRSNIRKMIAGELHHSYGYKWGYAVYNRK